jgi:nitrite reductase/ring-hydroxylating ferredoxin subunit/DMSO/TMAO reductase YedYZ heme-binding membrane subunit
LSHAYKAVGWNRQKRLYDLVLCLGIVVYLTAFLAVSLVRQPAPTIETVLIRAFGTCAFLLLHVVLSIGPLARLDRRFLPLLYNRRHLGVTMFLLALTHGAFSIIQFHALGDTNPLVSVLTSNGSYDSVAQFPFQVLGLLALVILFLMAATSHDFWLTNLTPPVWKTLHMLVYVAWGLLVAHVALGAMQDETHPTLAAFVAAGVVWVLTLHLVAGSREGASDRDLQALPTDEEGFVEVCRVGDIREKRARIICLSGERVAVFRYEGKISALSNVCQHQNGPLGEGRVIDGCITCPWHGFQYRPEDGSSPPPFTEKVPTFRVKVIGDRVLVHPEPLVPGTHVDAAVFESEGVEPTKSVRGTS